MRQLSDNAKLYRREHFLEVADRLSIYDLIIITVWGAIVLLVSMSNKLPPRTRAVLFAVATVAGGALIIIAARAQLWGLALVIGILLGILISELRHLR